MGMLESNASMANRAEGDGGPAAPGYDEYKAETKAIEKILKHEGGYQNKTTDRANKNSKGQWVGTNRGVTPAVYEEVNGKVPTASDMQKITKQEAVDIYRKLYARPVKENLGISPKDPAFGHVLDIAVNHGYSGAVAMIQRATGATVDGKAGPATRAAIAKTPDLNNKLVDERKAEYDRIIKQRPETSVYASGWHKRAESFRNGEPESKPDPVADGSVPRPEPVQGGGSGPTNGQDPLVSGGPIGQRP